MSKIDYSELAAQRLFWYEYEDGTGAKLFKLFTKRVAGKIELKRKQKIDKHGTVSINRLEAARFLQIPLWAYRKSEGPQTKVEILNAQWPSSKLMKKYLQIAPDFVPQGRKMSEEEMINAAVEKRLKEMGLLPKAQSTQEAEPQPTEEAPEPEMVDEFDIEAASLDELREKAVSLGLVKQSSANRRQEASLKQILTHHYTNEQDQ